MTSAIEDKWGLLTSSSLKNARACMRLWHYKDDLGYQPVHVDEALYFGDLMHLGLEAWWKELQRQFRAAVNADRDAQLEAALAAVAHAADPFERAKAELMLTGYHLRWKDAPFEPLHVETRFEIALVNPATGASSRTWRVAGKVDVIVRDLSDGLVKLMEHKTTSEDITPGSDYWKRLRLESQVSTYHDGGASIAGEAIASCIYDVLLKPALRPSTTVPVLDENGVKVVRDASGQRVKNKDGKSWRQTASSADGFVLEVREETVEEYRLRLTEAIIQDPNKYFARAEVVRIGDELEEFRFDTWQTARTIHEYRRAGRFPRNPDSCVRFGRTCAFFDVCTGAASLDDPGRFRRVQPHPELAEETADVSVAG